MLTHTYLCEKNLASTLRRSDARMCRTHARPFGYISRAVLIPAHIQSHPLILARSRRKKGREDVARGPTGPPAILVSCTCTSFRLILFLFLSLTPHPNPRVLSLSRSLFLVHAYPSYGSSSNLEDAAPVGCQSSSASSAELATGFSRPLAHSRIHSRRQHEDHVCRDAHQRSSSIHRWRWRIGDSANCQDHSEELEEVVLQITAWDSDLWLQGQSAKSPGRDQDPLRRKNHDDDVRGSRGIAKSCKRESGERAAGESGEQRSV